MRTYLFEAAGIILNRVTRWSTLKDLGVLSLRTVEEMLAAGGIDVSHERRRIPSGGSLVADLR